MRIALFFLFFLTITDRKLHMLHTLMQSPGYSLIHSECCNFTSSALFCGPLCVHLQIRLAYKHNLHNYPLKTGYAYLHHKYTHVPNNNTERQQQFQSRVRHSSLGPTTNHVQHLSLGHLKLSSFPPSTPMFFGSDLNSTVSCPVEYAKSTPRQINAGLKSAYADLTSEFILRTPD